MKYLLLIFLLTSCVVERYEVQKEEKPAIKLDLSNKAFDEIKRARKKERQDNIRWRKREAEQNKEIEKMEKNRSKMLLSLIPATVHDYTVWLNGCLLNGGKISHVYNYNFPDKTFYIVVDSMKIYPLYGASSMSIIVPEDIKITFADLGHNNIYYIKDFKNESGWIPLYSNIR